jgi:hypothetical protein
MLASCVQHDNLHMDLNRTVGTQCSKVKKSIQAKGRPCRG